MPLIAGKSPKAFTHNLKEEIKAGKPMKQSLAIAYSMKKRPKKMADGGPVDDVPEPDKKSAQEVQKGATESGFQPAQWAQNIKEGLAMAHGGMAMAHGEDIVNRIMRKRYSEGGEIANGGDDDLNEMADGKPNNFDDLALRDDLESTNSGASDGDDLGDAQEDHDRADIIARIMKSRMKKDKLPRPA